MDVTQLTKKLAARPVLNVAKWLNQGGLMIVSLM
jgi:hypothetical protein